VHLVIVSDTHTRHEELGRLCGDVLIHCGDGCDGFQRNREDLERLDDWFGRQQFERILCIGGNHDFLIEERVARGERVFQNAIYLQDEPHEFRGVRFYGSPWTPELIGWAFYLDAGGLRSRWSLIPEDTDVLITHTAPRGVLDRNSSGRHCGCPDLAKRLERLRPRLHCFGHNHASAGSIRTADTLYVNASVVNRRYEVARGPFELDL
jgi:Icc-related predicted phosphoesterase